MSGMDDKKAISRLRTKLFLLGLAMMFVSVWGGAAAVEYAASWVAFPAITTAFIVFMIGALVASGSVIADDGDFK